MSDPISVLAPQQREALRRRFRPVRVLLLFIGEAPPASGRFFYKGDSGLYRAIRDAFRAADPSVSDENFLSVFQDCGCYLIDACGRPVDRLDTNSRRAVCLAGEPLLSRKIKRLQPEIIVSLVRSIRSNIERAVLHAGWRGPMLDLPYPGRWIRHREIFTAQLLPNITVLMQNRNTHQ